VRAHIGVEGNEKADADAREGGGARKGGERGSHGG
jgi:hypothetical protein